jgi:antibiotic biosynthesis monooxygenase (ABM) superfamily enzyme
MIEMSTKVKLMQAIKIWVVIYPSITLFNILFGSYLVNFPLFLKTLALTLVLVPWMVFAGLPFINWVQQKMSKNEKP